jgi:hypothetical protein
MSISRRTFVKSSSAMRVLSLGPSTARAQAEGAISRDSVEKLLDFRWSAASLPDAGAIAKGSVPA